MPPHSATALLQALGQSDLADFDTTFLHQHEESTIRMGDMKKAQLATPEWNNALLYSLSESLGRQVYIALYKLFRLHFNKSTIPHRLNVKTHVFKKELQEYIPTQIEDRLRIETIIYVELSIVDHNNALVNAYDYARLPKDLFFTQPDKVMSPEEMSTKRILDISATLQCPSNGWQEEKEACLRCARRMSTKTDQTESRIMHMLPELHRTENGDALISFRSGVANIQFKINCYCGHKKEKEGFVIRFDSQSDASIASHVTLPLMFYHQNKNRVASRALAAAAKAQSKGEQQQQQQVEQSTATRNVVKSVTSKTKRESRSKLGSHPIGQQHQIPSPPNSLLDSPIEWSSSPEMDDFMDSSDTPFTVPSPPPPDPLISLFPDSVVQEQQQQPTIALISHMTPSSGPVRGGTLVTIHGTGFPVGEVVYVCFGENMVPIFAQRDHMLECVTPASNKADTVPVFAMNTVETNVAQATFTYVDDNEKELIKLALQRMMNISARVEGPLDNVLGRANEFALWSDLLQGDDSSLSVNSTTCTTLEKMVLQSFEILDSPTTKNIEGISVVNTTGHTMLHLAVALQYESLAKDLLLRSIDVAVQDKNGLTALDWARRLNNETMVELLSGTSAPVVAGVKLAYTAEHDEVAHVLQSSVSPSSRPTATDQSNVDYGQGGIAAHEAIQVNRTPPKDTVVDLAAHVDPHMTVEWEGFGQGPGNNVALTSRVEYGFLETSQPEEDTFVQQARKDTARLVGEMMAMDQDKPLTAHQQQQDPQTQYRKTVSAIPTTDDLMTDNVHVQEGHSPAVVCRLPIGGEQVGQAGIIVNSHHKNIAISIVDPATNPVDSSLPSARSSPVGSFDRTAPLAQDVVATEGSPGWWDEFLPAAAGVASAGQQQSSAPGCIQSIQSTARIDDPVVELREPTTTTTTTTTLTPTAGPTGIAGIVDDVDVVVGGVVDLEDDDQDHNRHGPLRQLQLVEQENPVVQAAQNSGAVVAQGSDQQEGVIVVVQETGSSAGGSHNSATNQAVVQSSRNDVESEPLLFLGGLPVTLSPRPNRTGVAAVSSNNKDESSSSGSDRTRDGNINTGAGSEDEA
ncbi:SPT3 Dosage dependent suppressor of Ty-induced promoter mutations-like protein [Mortierella claussenii]|nr:SPT3 Dosage dependent suppressor of Ty-induced promoter mutations-like protein [Mortierella claussenii]